MKDETVDVASTLYYTLERNENPLTRFTLYDIVLCRRYFSPEKKAHVVDAFFQQPRKTNNR